MIAYKLLRVRKDGSLGPLFINRRFRVPVGEWILYGCHPTRGFKIRPGWHCTSRPEAPHLSMKGRAWFEVEVEADAERIDRPASQGGLWYLAKWMRIIKKVEKGGLYAR